MHINSVNDYSIFGNKRKTIRQVKKVIRSAVGKQSKVAIGTSGFKVQPKGAKGSIVVEGSTDLLTLAKDFERMEKARREGRVKRTFLPDFEF